MTELIPLETNSGQQARAAVLSGLADLFQTSTKFTLKKANSGEMTKFSLPMGLNIGDQLKEGGHVRLKGGRSCTSEADSSFLPTLQT